MKSLCTLFVALLFSSSAMAQSIVIDPGHGGNDSGGTGNGMKEADIVLDTSTRFRDLLEADTADSNGGGSWTVSMTRTTDVFISLAGRSAYANSIDADRFMSIHANAFGTASANGTETFSYGEGTLSAELRNLVQEEMVDAWQLTNRGNKTANFSVLRNTAMPSELHELAFVTNTGDAAKLASEEHRQSAAEAHLRALQRHYDIEPYLPGPANADGSGTIAVQVQSMGEGVSEVAITLNGEDVGSTDDDGALRLEEVPAGEHLVGVWKEGYLAAAKAVTVIAEEEVAVLLDLELELGEGDGNVDETGGARCDTGGSCNPPATVTGGCSSSGQGAALPLAFLLLLGLARMRWAARQRF